MLKQYALNRERKSHADALGRLSDLADDVEDVISGLARGALIQCDCREALPKLPEASIDFVVTDPPYFIDRMDSTWDNKSLAASATKSGVIGGLPVGMKFDRKQGIELQKFMQPVAAELFRVLKPGAFCLVFSQARLYHRMAMAFDDAGFEIRDMLAWKHEGQAKAFSQAHFIRKNPALSEKEKDNLIAEMSGYKTPQLKPQMEPIVLAQKPREGTFVENWLKHGVGLVNFNESLDGKCPGNVMEVSKHEPGKAKIEHLTVKPLRLISHLINLCSRQGQIVLDPFAGSGTHGVAALRNKRRFIGMEKEGAYIGIVRSRLCREGWHCTRADFCPELHAGS